MHKLKSITYDPVYGIIHPRDCVWNIWYYTVPHGLHLVSEVRYVPHIIEAGNEFNPHGNDKGIEKAMRTWRKIILYIFVMIRWHTQLCISVIILIVVLITIIATSIFVGVRSMAFEVPCISSSLDRL